ncbi:hypothetical protein ACGF7W_19655 [Streptomyces sp. NPDC048219]|uniref:hypothetical protein n=1 Tax=Streptomyces sp. NPDC048219 TaxID=3365517 RepID=UPI00371D3075
MIIADAVDTLWTLAQAFALWFLALAAAATLALLTLAAGLWRLCRAVWRLVPSPEPSVTYAQRTARACKATAVALLPIAAYSATYHPFYAVPGLVGAGFFLAVAASYRREDQRQRARHEAARRAAAVDAELLPPVPCCPFWQHSDGEIHGPRCERRPRSYAAN